MLLRDAPTIFQENNLPAGTALVGISALVHAYGLEAPVKNPSCVHAGSIRGSRRNEGTWTVFDKRFAPANTLQGHLTFALRHDDMDLLALKRLFLAVPKEDVEEWVKAEPTGAAARRTWFLYEWLTSGKLDVPDAVRGNYVDAIDSDLYFTASPVNSPRHRVRDNLLGVPGFSPMIRKSAMLIEAVGNRWDTQAKELVGRISKGVIARAASFLLLADSQASYQIEGERPPRSRLERWMRAIGQAGQHPLTVKELVRLQHIVIEDTRFIKPGLREEGGFIGDRDWDSNPLPEFISARHEDLPALLESILAASAKMAASGIDAVLQSAAIAFSFVFVHPLVDGNGRLHRYMIHHVLAERHYTPPGLIFPVSSVLLDREEEYARQLRQFTGPLLPFIEWLPTEKKNVRVLNDTADLYRFGDYTELAEFLYGCVIRTIVEDLPREITYLRCFDTAKKQMQDLVEMPDAMVSNLIAFISQNEGRLSKKRRTREFSQMTDEEVAAAERIVSDAFSDDGEGGEPRALAAANP